MSAEANKALIRRFLRECARGNLAVIDETLSPNFVDHSLLPGQRHDRQGFKQSVAEMNAPFSDIRITIEHQVAEGDKIVTSYSGSSTHDRGPFMGVPPTGKRETFTNVVIHRVAGGKIVEEWSHGDTATIMQPALEQEIRDRTRVEQELGVARRIQQASLPNEVPALEGWEIVPYYQPAREVGGDFYDFHPLSRDRLGLLVGDATGKGVPAALVMSTTCGMLHLGAQASDSSPGEVLAQVNEALLARMPPNMFVTCFYAILDPKNGSLSYANAGHDLPYVRRGGVCEELRARGMPLGLMSGMGYEEKEIALDAGEMVFFYTDGLVEAHDSEGEMFGFPRLQALVTQHAEEERALEDFLMEELYSFVGEGWKQEDDITILTLRHHAT